jgi:hypothetical protein
MPNKPVDLETIKGLFDGIYVGDGGTAGTGRVWPTDRNALITVLTAQIVTFQTINRRPVTDGVVDPNGGTLREMNRLASSGPPVPGGGITATVMPAPDGLSEIAAAGIHVANPGQLRGTGMIDPLVVGFDYIRKLVKVEGSSIKWFGVVFRSTAGLMSGGIPHLNFTPTPIQGGYNDASYSSFGGWGNLWRDYTHVIGSQMVAAGVDQILVIPFYKTSQQRDLGDFLVNWKDVVKKVVEAAIFSVDIFFLRDGYSFDRIVSSSFSNGWVAHQGFNAKASGASAMTQLIVDLDGVAGGSSWTPPNGIIYRNRPVPGKSNPVGNVWYVGNRWSKQFLPIYGGKLNTHAACRNHLLFHALKQS